MYESTDKLGGFFDDARKSSPASLDINKDDLLINLMERGVSFPSELARQLTLPMESINQLISHWAKMGFIEHITPNPEMPQPEFKGRMNEMWAMGVNSYEQFRNRSWWTITLGGIEYIKIKYPGKGLRIKGSLVKKHNLGVDE